MLKKVVIAIALALSVSACADPDGRHWKAEQERISAAKDQEFLNRYHERLREIDENYKRQRAEDEAKSKREAAERERERAERQRKIDTGEWVDAPQPTVVYVPVMAAPMPVCSYVHVGSVTIASCY